MPRSRLRWRALAVLGALLSIIIDWPIGLAMPASSTFQPPVTANFANPYAQYSCLNCSASPTNMNLTKSGDRIATSFRGTSYDVNNSSDSGGASTNSSHSKRSSKLHHTNDAMIMPSVEKGIIVSNSNRSAPPERDTMYNKRKRKKSLAVLRANQIPTRTHNNPSSSSDVNNLINHNPNNNSNLNDSASFSNSHYSDEPSNKYNTSVEPTTTTMHAILDDAENPALVTATETSVVSSHHLSRTDRSVHESLYRHQNSRSRSISDSSSNGSNSSGSSGSSNHTNLDRNERSANLSHISGPARKIQLFIKHRWIQLLPDGTINGTQDDNSDYTILQRTTVNVGQIKIQGVATCLFLCMDPCGAVYGSKTFTDDCVFNESMEQHHYNTYSSTYNSNSHRTLYLALNGSGKPRRIQISRSRSLGKLATYTKAMTSTVDESRVEKLIARTFGENRVKHGLRQLCDAGKPLIELTAPVLRMPPKCNAQNNANGKIAAAMSSSSSSVARQPKLARLGNSSNNSNSSHSTNNGPLRKNNNKNGGRRRCRPHENEQEHNCQVRRGPHALKKRGPNRKCQPTQTAEECAKTRRKGGKNKQNKGANQRNRKNNNNGGNSAAGNNRKNKSPLAGRRKVAAKTTTSSTSTTLVTSSHEIVETSTATAPAAATTTTTTLLMASPTDTTTLSLPTLARSVRTQTIRQELSMPISNEEEMVSTEDSQQWHAHSSSTEVHDGVDVDDEYASMSAVDAHAQMVNGDDSMYYEDFKT